MSGLGLLNRRKWLRRSDAPVFYRSRWIRASEGGFLISETRLGAEVESGALLGVVTNPITNQRSEIRSPFGGRVIGMAQVMQPGYAAYHLGIDPEIADPVAGDDGDPFPDDAGHLEELDALEYSEEGFLDAGENIDDDPDTGR